MTNADQSSGFLLDDSGISVAKLHPAPDEYLLLPGVPTGLNPRTSALKLALIDSGVMSAHPQLRGLVLEQKDFTGGGSPEDEVGHGTVVALILLRSSYQPGNDTVPGILSAKVVGADGRIQRRHVLDAIHWLAGEKQARVINLSLGFRGTPQENAGLRAALAAYPQTLFAVAAGNFGPDTIVYPAGFNLPNVISVGATDQNGSVASYSGQGTVYAPGDVALFPVKQSPPSKPH